MQNQAPLSAINPAIRKVAGLIRRREAVIRYKALLAFAQRARPVHWMSGGGAVILILVLAIITGGGAAQSLAERLAAGAVSMPLPLPESETADAAAQPPEQVDIVTVKGGDTLASIFARDGFSAADVAAIMAIGDATQPLRRIFPGDQLQFVRGPDGTLAQLKLVLPENALLTVSRDAAGFVAHSKPLPVLENVTWAHGVIESSLFGAATEAGLSDNMTMQLIHLFGWDIDFGNEVRPGDSFTVLYQHTYSARDGSGDGAILAAEFHANGHVYTAIRYTDDDGHTGYYTADGHNVRKAFLRSPVKYTRVSSRFSMHRMNPVLHYVRPHEGVDLAAPEGTPIHVTADGTIIFRGRKGGYGNAVVVKHFGRYSTLYGHMSRFARGEHVGSHVHQGQVIGYVGHTGIATGPHVHYEFRINGRHVAPLKVKLPAADPIAKKYRQAYKAYAASLLAQLKFADGSHVALAAAGD
ncbi:MAG TPA: peptidoglycan DD-metalloendopeptidase family protein [Gammaproteobacteria bacterium]|nr:peptidoglycan DD-metalloendopeptidase family protein [Gammaproteobacteria bacterium]